MSAVRLQVIIKTQDAIPENYVTNSLCVDTELNDTKRDLIVAAIKQFYDSIGPTLFPATVSQAGHRVKFTELVGTPPIYPTYDVSWALASAPSATDLPAEVAMVTSFQGARTSGSVQARRRGRIYIGPLKTTTSTNGRPNSTAITTLATASSALGIDLNAVADTTWCVWSPTSGTAVPITDGWVDNAFDTQRRRGWDPTSRTTYFV